eukprot:442819-Rhodomonas_salina.1
MELGVQLRARALEVGLVRVQREQAESEVLTPACSSRVTWAALAPRARAWTDRARTTLTLAPRTARKSVSFGYRTLIPGRSAEN